MILMVSTGILLVWDCWGNGDIELFMEHQDELEQIMEIVKQSFDAQAE